MTVVDRLGVIVEQLVWIIWIRGAVYRCAAECAVRFKPVCADAGFFDTSTERFRAG
jgi:hypothetical protein